MGGKQGAAGYGPLTIPIDIVRCSDDHIRKSDFSTEHLRDTIADAGLLQPILAWKEGDSFVVIDGARRLAALKELGVQELIIGRDIVIDAEETDADARFKQVIANVQREDLNALELGLAFVTLKEEYGYHYNEISEIIGKTPHYVVAKVGLAKRLDPEVQRLYLEDLAGEKGIQSTFSDGQPLRYVMNLNVLEDIARVPQEAQLAAYQEIKARQMSKDAAIEYLRSVKQRSTAEEAALLATDCGVTVVPGMRQVKEKNVRRYILKIRRDVERLASTMQGDTGVEPDIDAEIDALIEQLNALRARTNAGDAACIETGPDQV